MSGEFRWVLRVVSFSKLNPVDWKTDWKIEAELLEYGVKFPQKMAPNGLQENRKLFINVSEHFLRLSKD